MPVKCDLRRVVQRLIRRNTRGQGVTPDQSEPIYRLPADHQQAAARMVDAKAIALPRFLVREREVDRGVLDPLMKEFADAFAKDLRKRALPFFIHSGFRTRDEQNALFARGVTRARFGQSAHNYGMAIDVIHFTRAWDLTPKEWAVVGLIGKEVARRRKIKVTWGGDWGFYDPAHWELAEWRDLLRS